jgi:hypothetical protein
LEEFADVGLHRRPVIVPRERGEDFRVREVLKVGVVLANEGFAEGGWDQNARREVGVFEECEALA